jgi:hypothetical protein
LNSGLVVNGIKKHEVMDHSVVASRSDCNTSVLEFPRVSFTFVAKWIVFSGDDERRRQTLEFLVARSERRHVRLLRVFSSGAYRSQPYFMKARARNLPVPNS